MTNVEQKQEKGNQLSELEYVYERIKDFKNVRYTTTDKLSGFTISCDTIYVKLDDIDFYLYQDEESEEFVLIVESKGNNFITHWHPQNYEEAIDDIKNIFEKGISIIYKKIDFKKEEFVDILFPIFLKDFNQQVLYQQDSNYRIINIKNEISR